MPAVIPFIPLIASVAGPLLSKAIGGGGAKTGGGSSPAPAAAPNAMSAAGVSAAPGTNPADYKNQETAYWQQLFAGTGQGLPGGALPPGVQENIDKQASLLGG